MDRSAPCTAGPGGTSADLPGNDAYGAAVAAVCQRRDPLPALRDAAAQGHPAAAADLAALTGAPARRSTTGGRWLRQHLQIVALSAQEPRRAEALLREHVTDLGCDPLALLVVARRLDGLDGARLADLRGDACSC